MIREFTATVYIFHNEKVLLHRHEKFGKWLPPGGHLEPNETPIEAAIREVKEETGLEIDLIEQENLKIQAENGETLLRPFLCLLENIPPYQSQLAHQHIDMIYLARPRRIQSNLNGFQWFSYKELEPLDLFPDTARLLRFLFKEQKLIQVITSGDASSLEPAAFFLAPPSDKKRLLDPASPQPSQDI